MECKGLSCEDYIVVPCDDGGYDIDCKYIKFVTITPHRLCEICTDEDCCDSCIDDEDYEEVQLCTKKEG